MLDGELAVPCKLQSAIAVSNTFRGDRYGWPHRARGVDSKVPCNVILRTVSELDRSSTKQDWRVPRGNFEVATYFVSASVMAVGVGAQYL